MGVTKWIARSNRKGKRLKVEVESKKAKWNVCVCVVWCKRGEAG